MSSSLSLLPISDSDIAVEQLCRCSRSLREQIANNLNISLVQLTDIIQGHCNPSGELLSKLQKLAFDSFLV